MILGGVVNLFFQTLLHHVDLLLQFLAPLIVSLDLPKLKSMFVVNSFLNYFVVQRDMFLHRS